MTTMSEKETIFFKGVYDMFGETLTRIMFTFYNDILYIANMLGLILSFPVKFVQFFKESYNNQKSE